MHFFRDGCVTDFCSCKIGIQYILYITSVLDKIAWSDFEQALPGPKGGGHDCMDAGGRATQERLPRKPGVILMVDLYTAVLDSSSRLRSTSCFHAVVRAVLPCPHEKITIFRGALKPASVDAHAQRNRTNVIHHYLPCCSHHKNVEQVST